MIYFYYLVCALIGYFLGSSNMALYISKMKKIDLRAGGSGNLGTSNATILLGKKAGALVFIHDVVKVFLAVFICNMLFNGLPYVAVVTSVAAVLGHMYPFYLNFKGGKGFASYIGMAIALDWKYGLIMIGVILLVSFICDWIVAGTLTHILVSPFYFLISSGIIPCLIICIASVCIFCKHSENYIRKSHGEEIGIREALFKKK